MLRRHRRLWFPLVALLLAMPLGGLLLAPAPARSATELRPLAPIPAWPRHLAAWSDLPPALDAWMRDHFGFRRALIGAYARLVHGTLATGTIEVLIGHGGRPYLRIDQMIEQSAGVLMRQDAVATTADMLASLRAALARRGVGLIVAPPPNASTIDTAPLPGWARNPGRASEYDALLAALATRGVAAVDLRPVVRGVPTPYRRYDSHWTPRAALAAINAVAGASGHPDWALPKAEALSPPVPVGHGDLLRMLDLPDRSEFMPWLAVPAGHERALDTQPYPSIAATGPHPGPTLLVIGDSFTRALLPPLLLARIGRVVWVYHDLCRFDFGLVDRVHPVQVWYMPTERRMLCDPGAYPAGLAADTAP